MPSEPLPQDNPQIRLVPAARFSLQALTDAYNQGRVDYLIPMSMNAARLAAYIRMYDVDLERSWVAVDGGEVLGLAMLGLRPGRTWVTRLGVSPAHRKHGVGELLVRALLKSTQEAGRPLSILEVIRENQKAHALFRKLGFVETRELLVLRRPAGLDAPEAVGQAGWLGAEDALDLLCAHPDRPAWTNEIETYLNTGDAQALVVNLPGAGGSPQARGWMVFRHHNAQLSHIMMHTESGSPDAVCRALIGQFFSRHPQASGYVENVPSGDPHASELMRLGFADAFRRIEMHAEITSS